MPIATVTQFTAGDVDSFLYNEFALAELVSGDSTTATIQRPTSNVSIVLTGANFSYDNTPTYDAGETVTGGTISQLEFYDNGTLALRITGLSILATDLDAALTAIATSNDYTLFDAILAAYTINYDGTLVPAGAIVSVAGSDGADTFTLGDGDYFISPGDGVDTINAGTTSTWTQLNYSNETGGGITVNWSAGTVVDPYGNTDTFTGRVDAIRGTSSADNVTGDSNSNSFRGLAGNDVFDGGDGVDEVRYDRDANNGGFAGVTVNLQTGVATDGFGDTDTLSNVERVRGTDSDDTLTGDNNDNRLVGLGGNDVLNGAGGNDEFEAGDGDDTINTGGGDNYVRGSTGNDTINIDPSIGLYLDYEDIGTNINFSINGTSVAVNKGLNGSDTVNSIDNLDYDLGGLGIEGGSGNDTYDYGGNLLGNQFFSAAGRGGNDTITNNGPAFVRADYREDGQDSSQGITYQSNNGSRVSGTVTGAGTGTDTLNNVNEIRGTDFADTFNGGDGNERFIMRGGDDVVNGGGGWDTARYDRNGMGAVTSIWIPESPQERLMEMPSHRL